MLYELFMADGSVVQTSMSGVSQQGELWIHVHGMSMLDCVNFFSDIAKTQRMTVDYDQTIKDEFDGFTQLQCVTAFGEFVKICIVRKS